MNHYLKENLVYSYDGYALTLTLNDVEGEVTLFGEEAADLFEQLESAVTDEEEESLIGPYFDSKEDGDV